MKFSADVRKTIVIVVIAAAVVFGLLTFGPGLFAQEQAKPADAPKLTTEQESTLENKIIKAELAARELSPEAIGKAVADLLTQRQRVYQQMTEDLNTYSTTLQKDGFTISRDPQTGKFSLVKK